MRSLSVKFLLILMAWFALLINVGSAAETPAAAPTVAVEAEGQVMAVPDLALLTVEVETQAPKAEAALQENSLRADALLKALKAALTPDDRVKTLGYRLSPVYPSKSAGLPEIKGYRAVHRLQIKLKGPERSGSIIDLAIKSGASGVSGPYWEHSRIEELQRQAAVAALERGRKMAEALAQAQGLKITGVEKISTGIHFRPLRGGGEYKALAAAPSTPIEVGEEEIKATVQAVFQVKP